MAENKQDGVAAGWERWNDWNTKNMRPIMDYQCHAAGIGPGQRVLDIGSGVGLPALMAAELVGESGHVLGVDVSDEMVAAAERVARAKGLGNVEFRRMDAHELSLPDAAFDAVTFSFGLMFCADRLQAVRELRRVLKPGGRFALAVWGVPAQNPFFTTVFRTVSSFVPPPAEPPTGPRPSMFDLGEDGALAALLTAGGFQEFGVEPVPMTMAFESLDQHFAMFADMAPPVKNAAETLSHPALADLKQALAEAVKPYTTDSRILLPAMAVGASGSK